MYKKSLAVILAVVLACSMVFFVSVKSVSAANNQIFWGAFVGPSHIDTPAQFEAFGTQVGKGLAFWENFQYWDRPQDLENDPNFDTVWMDACRNYGAIPLVTWDPGDGSGEVNTYLPAVISGHYDTYITQFAQAAKEWGHPFFIRFLHQTLYDFDSNAASEYKQSFIHVEDIFRLVGATQISWIWGPSYDKGMSIKTYSTAYPGDSYVDWVGMGGYNWGDATTFDQMFNGWYNANLQVAPNKPQMITEVGFLESSYKASLYTDMLKVQVPKNYPAIKALCYWEGPDSGGALSAIETNPNALQAFQQGIALNYYAANIFSNLNASPLEALSGITTTSTPSPTMAPTHWNDNTPTLIPSTSTPTPIQHVSVRFDVFDVFIVVVIVAIVFVVVTKENSKRNLNSAKQKLNIRFRDLLFLY